MENGKEKLFLYFSRRLLWLKIVVIFGVVLVSCLRSCKY